jgi:hypothetical protein
MELEKTRGMGTVVFGAHKARVKGEWGWHGTDTIRNGSRDRVSVSHRRAEW